MPARFGRCAAALLLAGLASGCASIYAKGTPFYSGPAVSEGKLSDAERVNVWPLAYYHDPVLSVLWPLFEKTPDHLALRPLCSVYRLDEPKREYNVLWPLAQFDFSQDAHRIVPCFWGGPPGRRYFVAFPAVWLFPEHSMAFPFFWGGSSGKRYFVAFPEVWWFPRDKAVFPFFWGGQPGSRYFASFPLFWYAQDEFCHFLPLWWHTPGDTDVLWPVFNWRDTAGSRGWRFWPLAGDYRSADGGFRYSFALWPLGHYRRDGDDRLRLLFPLYFDFAGKDSGRRAVVPLYYGEWGPDRATHLTPLYMAGRDRDFRWSLCLPLYYRDADRAQQSSRLVTPLFGRFARGQRSDLVVFPALSWLSSDRDDRDLWALGPLLHARWGAQVHQSHALPLYLYDRERGLLLTPLYAQGGGQAPWSLLLPLYYHRSSPAEKSSLLVTPLFARLAAADRTRWMLLPGLASMTGEKDDRSLWVLGPLVHARWGGGRLQNHFLPLYYNDREERLFYSPLYSAGGSADRRWSFLLPLYYRQSEPGSRSSRLITPIFGRFAQGEDCRWLVLPTLTSLRAGPEDRDLWTLGPLVHARWGGARHQSHVIPLYYYDREERVLITLPFSRRGGEDGFWNLLGLGAHCWWSPSEKNLLLPPALTFLSWGRQERDLWTLGPLVHARWGGARHQSHVIPLYYYDREDKLLLTLPFSRRAGEDGFWNLLGLLAHCSRDDAGHRTVRVLPPLTAFACSKDYGRASVYPLFSTAREGNRRATWVLPWFLFESRPDRHDNGFFPLWSWDSRRSASGYDRDFRILGWLYENHVRNLGAAAPGGEGEAVRTRVLWKLVDYQRARKDKSLDCFPFISWDSRETGFRRFAFAWRLFRWERSAGGGRKLDILFIPIIRRAGRPAKAPEQAPEPAPAPAQPLAAGQL